MIDMGWIHLILGSRKEMIHRSIDIDCSRIFVGRFFDKKYHLLKINNIKAAGSFAEGVNGIFLNTNTSKMLDENDYIEILPRIISHESLHMILHHFVGPKESVLMDNILIKQHRYDANKLEPSGL